MKEVRVFIYGFLILNNLSGQTIQLEYYRLIKKADSLFQFKNYKAAAFTYSDAFMTLGWKGIVKDRYNAACAWAMADYPDSAIFNLERIAYKVAYSDITRVSTDKNLNSLYSHKKWKPILNKIKANFDSVSAINSKLDKNLIRKLDSLAKEDQKWRNLLTRYHNNNIPKDSVNRKTLTKNMVKTDSMNSLEIRRIFYKYGFPNFDLVGQTGSEDFFIVVQHQDKFPVFQDSVLTSMKIEAEKGKASWANYAYLIDRVKINTGQLQIYGTQMQINKSNSSYEPKPVVEPDKLNVRRISVGLNTIEEYIAIMNEVYFGTLNKK
jgi:hypothetical protein